MKKYLEVLNYKEIGYLIPVLKKIYPETHQLKYEENTFKLYLKFPEITISNSLGLQHTIYDLYVCLEIYSSNSSKMDMTGRRFTVTTSENSYGYEHSHLSSRTGDIFTNFCLGTSNLAFLVNNVKSLLSEQDWEMFFLQLEDYLGWESLEGGPYKHISKIGNRINSINLTKQYATEYLMELVDKTVLNIGLHISDNNDFYKFKFSVNKNYPILVKEDSFLVSKIKEFLLAMDVKYLVGIYHSDTNIFVAKPDIGTSESKEKRRPTTFIFKGNKVDFVVLPNKNTLINDDVLEVHPIFLDMVVTLLNEKLKNIYYNYVTT